MNITDLIRNNTVRFVRYRQQIAWYAITAPDRESYVFPVPVDDVGDATIEATEKAIYFMRWIRQALAEGTMARAA